MGNPTVEASGFAGITCGSIVSGYQSCGMNERAAIFVLGMHRSGTSALTRVLSLLGASLPLHMIPPGIGNETGHWEPEASVRLHDRLFDAAGTSNNDLYGPPDAWFQTETAEDFVRQMKELIVAEFDDAPLFVLKDSRSALVFPLWRRALAQLDIRCLATIISRNPIEAALSLAARQTALIPEQSWPLDRGGLLWLRYTLAAERHTRGTARSFCRYADLLQDWRAVARQLGSDFSLSWSRSLADASRDIDNFLSVPLRHHHESENVATHGGVWSSWIAPIYETLRHEGEPDKAVFDAVGHLFERACMTVRPMSVPKPLHGATNTVPPLDGEIRTIATVNAIALLEAKEQAFRHARNLEQILEARNKSAKDAEDYARSLEAALAELHESHRVATEYAASLERSRTEIETHAKRPEAERGK